MVKKAQLLLGLGLLAALFAVGSCHKKEQVEKPSESAQKSELLHGLTKQQSAQLLVKFVGAKAVTVGQFAERLAGQSPYSSARYDRPEGRRAFLDEMVRFELLALEAEKRGYDQQAEVERVQKQTMVEQMMRELFEKHGVKLSDISNAEIQKYYDDHKSEFDRPLADARGVIQNRLWRAKRENAIAKFMTDLRSKADIQENAELLRRVRVREAPTFVKDTR